MKFKAGRIPNNYNVQEDLEVLQEHGILFVLKIDQIKMDDLIEELDNLSSNEVLAEIKNCLIHHKIMLWHYADYIHKMQKDRNEKSSYLP